MPKKIAKEVVEEAVETPETTPEEARLKMLVALREKLSEEGITRMSGLELKISQAEKAVKESK